MLAIIAGVIILLGVGTVFLAKSLSGSPKPVATSDQADQTDSFVPIDPNIKVTVAESRLKDNTVNISATGLGGKVVSIAYELTYDSQGLIKGVNSGSKPLDVAGKDSFDREVYLGTCSRNVCKPDLGVSKVSVVLEFTNTDGKKSQFSGDFNLGNVVPSTGGTSSNTQVND